MACVNGVCGLTPRNNGGQVAANPLLQNPTNPGAGVGVMNYARTPQSTQPIQSQPGQLQNFPFNQQQQMVPQQYQPQNQNVLGGQGYQPYQQQYQQNPQDIMQQLSQLQQFQNPGGQGVINYQAPGSNNSWWQNLGEGIRNVTVGEPGQALQFPNYTPLQQSVLNRLLLQGSQNTDFSGIENNARRNFQTQTIPSIAERFTSMGAGNRGSSAFAGQLGAAASDLESQLGALRGQYGLQQLQHGLQPQYQNAYIPRSPGLLQALPQAAATYFGVR